MIKKMILTGVLVFVAAFAFAEYYQYTDESGNQRFTDDLYQVPESQRQKIKTFESIESVPEIKPNESAGDQETEASAPSEGERKRAAVETETSPAEREEEADSTGSGEKTLQAKANELDKMQADLNKTRKELEDERAAIESSAPPKRGASAQQAIEYSNKVDNLNAKIEKYRENVNTYNDKVTEFNTPTPKKTE